MRPNREESVNDKYTLILWQSSIPEARQSSIPESPEAEGRLGVGVWGAKHPNTVILFIYKKVNRYSAPRCGEPVALIKPPLLL